MDWSADRKDSVRGMSWRRDDAVSVQRPEPRCSMTRGKLPADPPAVGRAAAELPRSPIAAQEFGTLRELRRLFSYGGLPPYESRSPEDYARIAAFFALQELMYI